MTDSDDSSPAGITLTPLGTYDSGVIFESASPVTASFGGELDADVLSSRGLRVFGPEGIEFVPTDSSPTGVSLLLAANEISGTTSIYQISVEC